MQQTLQEFVDSRGERLRVDREQGLLAGVKLLGLASRNGRVYEERAVAQAAPLYEGVKVNVNHAKAGPRAPRDYQDRLGTIRNVAFRPGQGLFGDLVFNPKHPLAEQLTWDAAHAPEQVGLSHNVLARTSRRGETTVVESISEVQSVDLVADPATTRGLFEQSSSAEQALESLTLDQLSAARPDLIDAIETPLRAALEEATRAQVVAREQRTLYEEHAPPIASAKDFAKALRM